jgi:hypothetical protein
MTNPAHKPSLTAWHLDTVHFGAQNRPASLSLSTDSGWPLADRLGTLPPIWRMWLLPIRRTLFLAGNWAAGAVDGKFSVEFSNNLADAVEQAGVSVIAVREGGREGVSGTLWREGIAVDASEISRKFGISLHRKMTR